MFELIRELLPINRSITGDGLRESLRRVGRRIPLEITEIPSGTAVFDWTIPREWNLRQAWIKDHTGQRVVDLAHSFLHVVGYSTPVHKKLPLAELRRHLFTLPAQPDLIPYRTSYYSETWGFCLPENQLQSLKDGEYEVLVDSELKPGSLTYGECLIRGASSQEVLLSTHCCHPTMCNDNLSGMAVATAIAERLRTQSLRYSYRVLFLPGTIGAIAWLSKNEACTDRIVAGLTLALLGDAGKLHYKKSRRGDAVIDRAVARVLRDAGSPHEIRDFSPYGYDERQYCSPGFNLPVGCLSRTPFGEFPEYHTSADNLDFISTESLNDSLKTLLAVISAFEDNATYRNLNPKCEPQLGKSGLYSAIGGASDPKSAQMAMLWVLNLADGGHDLLSIADRSGLPFAFIREAATRLLEAGLLREEISNPPQSTGERATT